MKGEPPDDRQENGDRMSEPTTAIYRDGTLWVGTVPLDFAGYAVRRTGQVVVGWRHATPGVEISSVDEPFDRPVVRAVAFSAREPVAEDPERLLRTAHETVGLLAAPVIVRGTLAGEQRHCWYSVVEGPMDSDPQVVNVSAAVVAFGGDNPAVGVAMSGPDRTDLQEMIIEVAQQLVA